MCHNVLLYGVIFNMMCFCQKGCFPRIDCIPDDAVYDEGVVSCSVGCSFVIIHVGSF